MAKKEILELFKKKPERFYKVKLFDELGFKRKQVQKLWEVFLDFDRSGNLQRLYL
jgi:hypothetical protein